MSTQTQLKLVLISFLGDIVFIYLELFHDFRVIFDKIHEAVYYLKGFPADVVLHLLHFFLDMFFDTQKN